MNRSRRGRSTSRCSPTACAPNASRASPSTSPTAISPPPRRKFIIADTPGHEQYTRNMATGASTADLAIMLIDARNGVLPQSRRHAYIASLLGIPHFVVAVNKMDLVGLRRGRLRRHRARVPQGFARASSAIPRASSSFPSARSKATTSCTAARAMPWFNGPDAARATWKPCRRRHRSHTAPFRFPVQRVIRPDHDFPRLSPARSPPAPFVPGDAITVLCPRAARTRVKRIVTWDGDLDEAVAPHVRHAALERRNRHQPRRHDRLGPEASGSRAALRRQRRVDATSSRSTPRDRTCSSTPRRSVPAEVKAVRHRVNIAHPGTRGGRPAGDERHRRAAHRDQPRRYISIPIRRTGPPAASS